MAQKATKKTEEPKLDPIHELVLPLIHSQDLDLIRFLSQFVHYKTAGSDLETEIETLSDEFETDKSNLKSKKEEYQVKSDSFWYSKIAKKSLAKLNDSIKKEKSK
ncbi:hypothetical protein HON01_02710, partial [Candidatus Woesearchaeota archaeon]|nr:hypothetical protein [Candidatus Woesearchaeota archaeon]